MKLNWGNYIFIFIIIFLTLCTIFIIFSLRQDIDLVSENYYEEGADYTSEMKIIERSAIFSDSLNIIQEDNQLSINLSKSLQEELTSIDIWFYRPSDKDSDYRTVMEVGKEALYIEKKILSKGRYILNLSWEIDGKEYSVKKDIFIN